MVVDEAMYSSFEVVSEEQIAIDKEIELKRKKILKDDSILNKMRGLTIDYKATKLYFKLLKDSFNDKGLNQDAIVQMTELIHHELS
jgi:uncharacterized protein (DUF2344 family)